jgi:hypothetical protein
VATFLPRLRIMPAYKPQATFQTPNSQSDFTSGNAGVTSFYRRMDRMERMGQRMDRDQEGRQSRQDSAIQAAGQDQGGELPPGSRMFVSQADLAEEAEWQRENDEETRASYEATLPKPSPYLTRRR